MKKILVPKFETFQKSKIHMSSCIKKMLKSKMSHLTHLCGKEAVLASKPKHSRMNPSPLSCCNLLLFPSVTTYMNLPSPLQPNIQGQPLKTGLRVSLLGPIPLQFSPHSFGRPVQPERTKDGDGLALTLLEEATIPSTRSLATTAPAQIRCRHSNVFQLLAFS